MCITIKNVFERYKIPYSPAGEFTVEISGDSDEYGDFHLHWHEDNSNDGYYALYVPAGEYEINFEVNHYANNEFSLIPICDYEIETMVIGESMITLDPIYFEAAVPSADITLSGNITDIVTGLAIDDVDIHISIKSF